MFEGPPFKVCWACSTPNLGVLSVQGNLLTRRCRACRLSLPEMLPPVSKKIIYLDQFAISQIFKLRSGRLAPESNSFEFWRRADQAMRRAYFLQQAVFPASDIHARETLVWSSADELRSAHTMLAGGVSYRRLEEIEMQQITPFAQAYRRAHSPPSLDLRGSDVLVGEVNAWLPRLNVMVDVDYSSFAAGERANRDRAAGELAALAAEWGREKPTFKEVFTRELDAFASVNLQGLAAALTRASRAVATGDQLEFFEATHARIYTQFLILRDFFESTGISTEASNDEVVRYWRWPGNAQLPYHRLSACLFALLARKMAAGQRKPPSAGMLNDFDAISYFGPYVDAMLLDRECCGLIKEMPRDPRHLLRAEVFSLADGDSFIRYLDSLADTATPE